MNYSIAKENLLLMKDALDVIGVPFFLTCGTLLGCIRDKNFIAHDSDVDLGIFIEDHVDEIVKTAERYGFSLYHQFGTKEKGLEYSFMRKGVKVDLFFFYKDIRQFEPVHWMAVYGGEGMDNMCRYIFPIIENLVEREFNGYMFNVPEFPENFLDSQYGGDWRIPMKHWHWFYSPYNREYES